MYMISVIHHLIHKEVCFPAMKLVWDDQVDKCHFGELPKMTPSHYCTENRMTTEERHALLTRQMSRMSVRKPGVEVVIEPPIIVFQSYQYGETYTFPIVVRNISKNSQKVALLMDESLAFKFDESSQRVAKFPCGMCITATIKFTPDSATKDFYHRLVVSTNTTKVSVPIVAIGTRPLLNAPDSLVISDAPVRHWTMKPVTVLNTGKKVANFTVDATGSFSVKPEKGAIAPNQAFTFQIGYFSKEIASHEGEVCIIYENGEKIFLYLRGNSVNAQIKLSVPDMLCEDTFKGLQTRTSFFIENGSDYCAKFLWRQTKTLPDIQTFTFENEDQLVEHNPHHHHHHHHHHHLTKLETESLFSSDNFHIYPLFGEVKPRSKTEIHLVFSPTDCKFYEGTTYLQISGLEHLIPFSFFGRGLGPKFKLGFQVLDVGEVALGGVHTYEVPLQNISEIAGSIQCDGLIGSPSGMGLKVEPYILDVGPGHYAAFYVNFMCTGKPGVFKDEIKFSVPSTGDAFYVTVHGSITYPLVRFTETEVHLGKLSFGFPKTYHIPIVNESLNFVDTELEMEFDGTDPYIESSTLIPKLRNELTSIGNPQQFKMTPSRFTLRPKGLQKIVMTVYPCQIGQISNRLNCWITDMSGNNVETIASIALEGLVVSPIVKPVVDTYSLKECYLQFPYNASFVITNPAEMPVLYQIIQSRQSGNLKIESPDFVGSLEPFEEKEIPFEFICSEALPGAGESYAFFELMAIGSDVRMGTLTIRCEPIASKIEASQKNVDFGKIDILEEKVLFVDIINTSPMDIPYTTEIIVDEQTDRGQIWEVVPPTGVLLAQTRTPLNVKLFLKEVGYHAAHFNVLMTEPMEHTIEVRMKAIGIGSSLMFTPPIDKAINFGANFVKTEKVLTFTIVNNGINPRALEWRPQGEKGPVNRPIEPVLPVRDVVSKLVKKGSDKATDRQTKELPKTKRQKEKEFQKKRDLKREEAKAPQRTTFVVEPSRIVIDPGQSGTVTVSAFSAIPRHYDEGWNLWSYVPATKGGQAPVDDDSGGSQSQSTTVSKVARPKPKVKSISNDKGGKAKKDRVVQSQLNLHLRPTVINEVRLTAHFETPGLKFSTGNVEFLIEATPNHENFIAEETIKMENIGALPIKVHLRTKFPFSFYEKSSEDTPVEAATYELTTHSKLSFVVQFDGRHLRKELGVVTFDGLLEAGFDGLNTSESVELHGEVRFPQVDIDRDIIDFGTVMNGMEGVEQLIVQNTGPFCLTYKWYIKPNSTQVHQNPEPEWSKDLHFDSYMPNPKQKLWDTKNKASLLHAKKPEFRRSLLTKVMNRGVFKSPSRDAISLALGFDGHGLETEESSYDDFTQFLSEKMYRARMMEFMGLKDAEYEAEDEINYLAYYNQNAFFPREEFNTNELIDIIPLAGVIEAGKSQTFTLVLYGYPDITFETSLILYIEGGARKTVLVKGETQHPNMLPESELPTT